MSQLQPKTTGRGLWALRLWAPGYSVSIAVLALCACAATLERIRPVPTIVTNYDVGEVRSVGVGGAIFDVQSADKVPEFVALRAHDPGRVIGRITPTVFQGQRFRAITRLKGGGLITFSPSYDSTWLIVVTPEGKAIGFYDGRGWYSGGRWPADPLFAVSDALDGHDNAFRAQLIYAGLDGTTIRATYREFAGDFERPAYTQDIRYNVHDSTLDYKSIRIDLLEVDSSRMRYRVRDDGALVWLPTGGKLRR